MFWKLINEWTSPRSQSFTAGGDANPGIATATPNPAKEAGCIQTIANCSGCQSAQNRSTAWNHRLLPVESGSSCSGSCRVLHQAICSGGHRRICKGIFESCKA